VQAVRLSVIMTGKRSMPYRARVLVRVNAVIGTVAVALAAVLAVVFLVIGPGEDKEKDRATAAATTFINGWVAGDFARAGAATNAPADAEAALNEAADRLSVTATHIGRPVVSLDNDKRTATVRFRVRDTLAGLGDWDYETAAQLEKAADGGWKVTWSPRVIHPQLTAQTRLGREREVPERAPILDRDGKPLVTEGPVITFGIWPSKLTDPDRAYDAIGKNLDVDVAALRSRVAKTQKDQFLEIITLRESEAGRAAAALKGIPGVIQREGTRPLARTREFARAVLGTVAPATAETLKNAGPTASPTDLVGSSGLQVAHQRRLAGTPAGKVLLVDRKTGDAVAPLHDFTGKPGKPLTTTLDLTVQETAEAALSPVVKPAALVAVQVSTGQILAAANGPGAQGQNLAFDGRYPPGSTFKVVTTAALLDAGVSPSDPVKCPETVTVQGKDFENQDTFALGTVPFRTDFAQSCNTAFVGLRERLSSDTLPKVAAQFGLGGAWQVGLAAFSGSVPEPVGDVEKAAEMIGQGKVLVSPLAMASVAATVAAGEFHQPYLLDDPGLLPDSARFRPATQVSAAITKELRSLMREVVERGSGRALRDLPGDPGAKTGTAEFGRDRPPQTHAWMIGFRGDIAFAVLLQGGGTGGKNAGPVAARFLDSLPAP
jgi:cell division protein FtsI/penicillin-binding protein 2